MVQLEVAIIHHRTGDTKLSVRMFAEAFSRQEKQGAISLKRIIGGEGNDRCV